MKPLRFAIFDAGFWVRVQLATWREVSGVECVAIYRRCVPASWAFAAYDSARKGAVMKLASHDRERLLDSMGRLG